MNGPFMKEEKGIIKFSYQLIILKSCSFLVCSINQIADNSNINTLYYTLEANRCWFWLKKKLDPFSRLFCSLAFIVLAFGIMEPIMFKSQVFGI